MSQIPRLYNSQRWRKRRAQQLREHPLCRICDEVFRKVEVATVADHVEPHKGDEAKFWSGALQSLCKSCHDSIKQQQERSGTFSGSCRHGWPLDLNHPWNLGGRCRACHPGASAAQSVAGNDDDPLVFS